MHDLQPAVEMLREEFLDCSDHVLRNGAFAASGGRNHRWRDAAVAGRGAPGRRRDQPDVRVALAEVLERMNDAIEGRVRTGRGQHRRQRRAAELEEGKAMFSHWH